MVFPGFPGQKDYKRTTLSNNHFPHKNFYSVAFCCFLVSSSLKHFLGLKQSFCPGQHQRICFGCMHVADQRNRSQWFDQRSVQKGLRSESRESHLAGRSHWELAQKILENREKPFKTLAKNDEHPQKHPSFHVLCSFLDRDGFQRRWICRNA